MKKTFTIHFSSKNIHTLFLFFLAAAFLLICVSPVPAQNNKKKKKDTPPATDSANTLSSLPDEQQIEYMLSDMLGAWQLGDIDKLRKDYADEVSVVNGAWAPPVFGWTNYLAVYQQQRTRMQQIRMDRSNTYIKVNGTVAWACYQWDFAAIVDGQPAASQGHTTVVMEKRSGHWVIVHNHTSQVPGPPPMAPAKPADPPAKP